MDNVLETFKMSNWVDTKIFLRTFEVNSSFEVSKVMSTAIWPSFSPFSAILLIVWTFFLFLLVEMSMTARRFKNFPPGPRSLVTFFWKWRRVIWSNDIRVMPGVKLGQIKGPDDRLMADYNFLHRKGAVLISDFEILREAFKNPAILGRPTTFYMQMFPESKNEGMMRGSGSSWRILRRFLVSQLKSFGLGHKKLGPVIADEAFEIVATIRAKQNQPFSTHNFFNVPVLNVLWNMISGQKLKHGDPKAKKLVQNIERASHFWLLAFTYSNYSFGRFLYWILVKLNWCPFYIYTQGFREFTVKMIEERKVERERVSHGRKNDFLDSFLHKIESTIEPSSPFYGQTGYENLCEVVRDIFIAGTETTGTTVSWALLYLALHPDKQEKVQREIDAVLQDRTPTLHDRFKMKYTWAVINESLRMSTNLPFGLPHRVMEDTKIGKFAVPKDTTVISSTFAIHHRKETWGDPFVFRPERFLSEDGCTLIKYEEFIPFGTGKRICPGASLAVDHLFMLITIIFREFSLTWNPAEPKPGMGARLGIALAPHPHTLIATERKRPGVKGQRVKN